MTSTRVALDVSAVPPDPRGAGRYALELATALDRRRDVDLTLVARAGDKARWAAMAPAATLAGRAPTARPLRLAWEQVFLSRLVASLPVDVLHGPHYTMPARAPRPTVVTVHDLTFFDHPEWHERSKVAFFRRAISASARRAAALVCVSRHTAARLEALCHPRPPVIVIPHGVDHGRFNPRADASDADALVRLGARPPYVAFVGTLEPRKAVPVLVRAFDDLASRHRDLSLVVAGGRGWGGAAVDAAVAASRHRERIVRPGYIDDDLVPALLRGASAVAYPSLEEGFGLPALEALACGTPLVTTTGSAMEEVAGDSAWLVSPGDVAALAGALETALGGGPEVDDRRRRGLARVEGATWDACAAAHARLYASVSPGSGDTE